MQQLRHVAAWALRYWAALAAMTVACLISASLWSAHMARTGTPFGWPVTELLGAALVVAMGLLWAPLLSDVEARKASALLRRLGRLPDPMQALLAATLVLSWTLAGLLLLDGAVGAVRLSSL
jgi:hypothetical protein